MCVLTVNSGCQAGPFGLFGSMAEMKAWSVMSRIEGEAELLELRDGKGCGVCVCVCV